MRLNKFLAASGCGSRRACDKLVEAGVVEVNGEPVTGHGLRVDPGHDVVTVDGRTVRPEALVHFAFNKPRDVICTTTDPGGRRTVHDLLPPELGDARVFTVGRLDRDSEGLLLVTNDGDWAQGLLHPRHHVEKEYEVELARPLDPDDLGRLRGGLSSRDEMLTVLRAEQEGPRQCRVWLGEGRNRHIRRMFERLSIPVQRLRRVAIGPLRLTGLASGRWRRLTPDEVVSLTRK